jgi:hypothetical protein
VPADERIEITPVLSAGVDTIAGEPRVRYLHVADGAAGDVAAAWRAVFGDRAWVLSREEAVDDGWFGPVPPAHAGRIGDVVVICQGRTVSLGAEGEPPAISRMIAFHGSVTAAEMTIPLVSFVGGSG